MPYLRSPGTWTHLLVLALACCAAAGCDRHAAPALVDAGTSRAVEVRVPGALRVARGLDTLSVELDPEMLVKKSVRAQRKRTVGVAYTARVFERGQTKVQSERRGYVAGRGFDVGVLVWRSDRDLIPRSGKKYLVELHLVLFETDVPPGAHWSPRAGHFHVLLEKTLRQAEE